MNKKNPTKNDAIKKLEEIQSRVKVEAKPAETKNDSNTIDKTTEYKGVSIVDKNGSCQIFFRVFPSSAVRTYLKRHGFLWSANDQCWSCERSKQALFHAEKAIDKMMSK